MVTARVTARLRARVRARASSRARFWVGHYSSESTKPKTNP